MTLEVSQDKLHHTSQLLRHWLSSPRVTKSHLQSLVGKLFSVCACISPRKIFKQRILRELRRLPHKCTRFTPSSELLAYLRWWDKFLSVYNGISLLCSSPWIDNEFLHWHLSFRYPLGLSAFHRSCFFDHHLAWNVSRHSQHQIVVLHGYWSELTTRTLNLPATLAALSFLSFSHVYMCFGFMLHSLILSYTPYTSRATRTLSSILLVNGIPILIFMTPSMTMLLFLMIACQRTLICSFYLFHFECHW